MFMVKFRVYDRLYLTPDKVNSKVEVVDKIGT